MSEQPLAPQVSIIVISYNTRDITLECLRSVYAETRMPFELIVVDNASSDGSAEAIRDEFPKTILLAETTNHGFAPAHDIALPHATAPWILLLNPDTVVLDGALDKLMCFAEQRPDAGIWGGRTLYPDGALNLYSCWGRMTLWSVFCRTFGLSGLFPKSEVFNSEVIGAWPRDTEREVDIVTGCLFLMRRTDWDRLNGFDPTFWMYGEEADLCLRARKLGMHPMITPEATIIHYGGASETIQADKMVRLMKAKVELIKRHFHPAISWLGRLLFAAWPLSRKTVFGLASLITGKQRYKERAGTWSKVWKRRSEWWNGMAPV